MEKVNSLLDVAPAPFIPSFEILKREQTIPQYALLEASAGTGKTFTIENMVVRLLLENDQLNLDHILILTFTNAATQDLRARVSSNLLSAIRFLNGEQVEGCPDYLLSYIEQGAIAAQLACQRLRTAYYAFERSQIFTLHAFCQRCLGEFFILPSTGEGLLSRNELKEKILDYIRTGLNADYMHPVQVKLLWKKLSKLLITEEVINKFAKDFSSGVIYKPELTFRQAYESIVKLLYNWKNQYGFTAENIVADFALHADKYKEVLGRDEQANEIKVWQPIRQLGAIIERGEISENEFAELLQNEFIWNKLDPEKLKKKAKESKAALHYPDLDKLIRTELIPILDKSTQPQYLETLFAAGCQQLLTQYMQHEQRFTYDDLLKLMVKAVDDPLILKELQSRYKVAIVDEFQDTDPLQWEMLYKLFLAPDQRLYLVGDPKQSIYAFRQADIYTYLNAAEAIGENAVSSLDTNFRSHPKLIDSLNQLFDIDQLIYLPAADKQIPYRPVKAGKAAEKMQLLPEEEIGVTLVYNQEEKLKEAHFYHYIIEEIQRLHSDHQVPFNSFAILVKDRTQGAKVVELLRQYRIPFTYKRENSFSSSTVWRALKELIASALYPRNLALLKLTLGGNIFSWNYHQVLELNNTQTLMKVLLISSEWHRILMEKGFASLLEFVLHSKSFHDNTITVGELILGREGGDTFFKELMQVADLIMDSQALNLPFPQQLLEIITQLEEDLINNETMANPFQDSSNQGVTITTIHSSKGLEYDVVFAIGVMKSPPAPSLIVPHKTGTTSIHEPVDEASNEYLQYTRELDAEKMRQFYVAATRARYKLVLFAQLEKVSRLKPAKSGRASLINMFLAHCLKKSWTDLYESLANVSLEAVESHFSGSSFIKLHGLEGTKPNVIAACSVTTKEDICPPERVHVSFPSTSIFSFTSLSHHIGPELTSNITLEAIPLVSSSVSPPYDFQNIVKNSHTMPASAETGIFLHALFEKVDLKGNIELLYEYIEKSNFKEWKQEVLNLVSAVLKADLGGFCLQDVNPEKVYRETEFIYSTHSSEVLLKGVIDFVFEHNGLYYIVDWKSNWLGPDASFYTQGYLENAMLQNQYHLQASIYAAALKRYLEMVETRPFEDCFGGVIYLFLRGMPEGQGIYKCNNLIDVNEGLKYVR